MRFSLLLADADNTLLDFHAAEHAAFFTLAERFCLHADEAMFALYRSINHKHWALLHDGKTTSAKLRIARFADFAEAIGLQNADPQQLSDCFVEALGQQGAMVAGAEEFVKRVSRYMPVCIVTNGFAAVQKARFARSPLRPYLTDVLISENFSHAKPHPEMIQAALRRFAVNDPAQAVMIGDNEDSDIAAAVQAGTQSILFTGIASAPETTRASFTTGTLQAAGDWILKA